MESPQKMAIKRIDELQKMYDLFLSATGDVWVAEKICLLSELEVLVKVHHDSYKISGKLQEIMRFILNLDNDSEEKDFKAYYADLFIRFPAVRSTKQNVFYPSKRTSALHIHPEKITDLQQYVCPYCKVNHLEIIHHESNGFSYNTAGCKSCNKSFTPDELDQIRFFSKLKPSTQ